MIHEPLKANKRPSDEGLPGMMGLHCFRWHDRRIAKLRYSVERDERAARVAKYAELAAKERELFDGEDD